MNFDKNDVYQLTKIVGAILFLGWFIPTILGIKALLQELVILYG